MSEVSETIPTRATRRRFVLRWVRRTVQIVTLLFVLWLITRMNVSALFAGGLPPHIFLALDPLVVLTEAIDAARNQLWHEVGRELLHALPLLLLALFFGRVFCGWLCPLGTCIDGADHLTARRKRDTLGRRFAWVKFAVLAAVVVTALFGRQLLYLLDPIPLFTRSIVTAIFPFAGLLISSTAKTIDSTALFGAGYQGNVLATVILLLILGAGFIARRFWCRVLCPLGALYGLLSRFAPLGRNVSDGCTHCGRCVRDCRMGATPDGVTQAAGECIVCGACKASCPAGVIRFKKHGTNAVSEVPVDVSRRRLIGAAAIGAVWAGTLASGSKARLWQKNTVTTPTLLRPPHALPEPDFLARCTRCGACLKTCPTGGLQPALTEAGIEGVWTPVLVPRLGECAAGCNMCPQVCPTAAIREFPAEAKSHLYIGTARVDHSACLMWQDNSAKRCLVCDESCPYDAIYVQMINGKQVPFVNEAKCVGCGLCEKQCPVGPTAAIRVLNEKPFGDHRTQSLQAQYDWQQEQLQLYSRNGQVSSRVESHE